MAGQLDQLLEVGEIPDPPIARRADAVELTREQPAAVETTPERPRRGHDQRYLFDRAAGVGQVQPVAAAWQFVRPCDEPIAGLAFRDKLRAGHDFPAHRKPGRGSKFAPRRPARSNHDRLAEHPARRFGRQGTEDDFQRDHIGDMPTALPIHEFGLNSQLSGFGE